MEHFIITIENIIEEAKEQNKECWILFQDMKKTFDSVSKKELIKALQRINISHRFNRLIENTCTDRVEKILINKSQTEQFITIGGIDQGNSLSLLL